MILLRTYLTRFLVLCLTLVITTLVSAQAADELLIVLWSPNGEMIATGNLNGRLQIWNKNGTLLLDQVQDLPVSHVTWSGDNSRIALQVPGNKVRIINVSLPGYSVGANLAEMPQSALGFIAWSPTNNYIATSTTNTNYKVQLWDITSATRYPLNSEHSLSAQRALKWSPDGNFIATANEGQVIIWDVRSFKGKLVSLNSEASALTWSPDGKFLAVHHFKTSNPSQSAVIIYDTTTTSPTTVKTFIGAVSPETYEMSWSPDGNRIASSVKEGNAYKIIVFSSVDGSVLATYTTSKVYPAYALSWSPDGTQLAYPDVQGSPGLPPLVTPPFEPLGAREPSVNVSVSAAQSTIQSLESFLISPTCQQACFLGIEPGVTTRTQVEEILAQARLSYTAYAPPESAEVYQILIEEEALATEYPFRVVNIAFLIGSPEQVAYVMMLIDETPIHNIIQMLGYPTDIQTDSYFDEFVMLYPAQNIVFMSGDTSPNKDTVGYVNIMPQHYLLSVYTRGYSLSTLPACEPVVLCAVPTATPFFSP